MRRGAPGHEGRGRRAGKQLAVSALGLATVVGGCVDPGIDCWTRERIEAAAQGTRGPFREVVEGVVAGEVMMEDPTNWWTGARFTGERCTVEVEHRQEGTFARTQFLEEATKLEARLGPADTPAFVGRTRGGGAVVLQHHRGRPVSLTLTRFEEDGALSYGACSSPETPFLDCHAGRPGAD